MKARYELLRSSCSGTSNRITSTMTIQHTVRSTQQAMHETMYSGKVDWTSGFPLQDIMNLILHNIHSTDFAPPNIFFWFTDSQMLSIETNPRDGVLGIAIRVLVKTGYRDLN